MSAYDPNNPFARDAIKHMADAGYSPQLCNWEGDDMMRYQNFRWGRRISDMTLVVGGKRQIVVRRPNFPDMTTDAPTHLFQLLKDDKPVSLKEYLGSLSNKSLWRERDTTVLASTQCCFLPVGTTFGLGVYTYGGRCLSIVSSNKGTHVIDGTKTPNLVHTGTEYTFTANVDDALTVYQVPIKYSRSDEVERDENLPILVTVQNYRVVDSQVDVKAARDAVQMLDRLKNKIWNY